MEFFNRLLSNFNSETFLAKKIGVYNSTLNRWRRGKRMIPLDKIKFFSDIIRESYLIIEKNIIEIQSGRNKNTGKFNGKIINPNFPIKFNANIAKIIGHILHDGSINENRVIYTNTSKKMLKNFLKLINKEFGCIQPCFHTSSFGGISLQAPKILAQILIEGFKLQPGKKTSVDPEIPSVIMQCQELEILNQYINAAFSDDGCVSKKGILFGLSKSKDDKNKPPKLLRDMHELLGRFEIKPSRMVLQGTYMTKNGNEGESWYLYISSKESLRIFYNKIGFDLPLKQKKLKQLLN